MVHFAMPPPVIDMFKGLKFPATTADIIAFVQAKGGSTDMLATLEAMPSHTFSSPEDIVMRWGIVQEFSLAETPTGTMPPPAPAPANAPAVTDEAA